LPSVLIVVPVVEPPRLIFLFGHFALGIALDLVPVWFELSFPEDGSNAYQSMLIRLVVLPTKNLDRHGVADSFATNVDLSLSRMIPESLMIGPEKVELAWSEE
jgi:hypothetical protein